MNKLKKWIAMLLASVMVLCCFTGCDMLAGEGGDDIVSGLVDAIVGGGGEGGTGLGGGTGDIFHHVDRFGRFLLSGRESIRFTRHCEYTMQVLYRLGFAWPVTTWDYIARFVSALGGLGYFEEELQEDN